jgi:RecB family exonuclease
MIASTPSDAHDHGHDVDPFLTQLAELCRTHRTRVKWVFVPSFALGHTLGERLVLDGTDWANLRFVRPFDVALEMAAPFLLDRGLDPVGDGIGPALVMRLLLDLPAGTPRYFRRLAEQPRMAEALWAAIRELRLAGLTADSVTAGAFANADKAAELKALVTAYETHLAAHALADAADVYRETLVRLDVGPVLAGDLRLELPGVIWTPLERSLLDALPGERVTPRTVDVPGSAPLRRLTMPPVVENPAPVADAGLLAFVLRPTEAPLPRGDGSLTMFRAGGKEAEVDEVFRRIFASGLRLDHVEVAFASVEYAVLFWEKAQRHEVPITIGGGVPITLTRPARALLAFCEWIEAGFPAGGLRRFLQSGDLVVDIDGGPTAGQAARLLARSNAAWGRHTYGAALAGLIAASRQTAADAESDDAARAYAAERAQHAERLQTWIAVLLALVPEAPRVTASTLASLCARFVEDYAAKGSELDGEAAVAIVEAVDELRALGDLEWPWREAFGFVRHRLDALTVGGDRARPGHLYATPLRQAGYSGRANTFVVGLEEGRVFPALLEDAVLLDTERQALSPMLPTSLDRASEVLHEIAARLASLGSRVCLSFSCRDLRQHRETFPSWLLLQALRLRERDRAWTYRELAHELGEPVSAVPASADKALSEGGWWLHHLHGVGGAAFDAVRAAFPSLAQGDIAEAARHSEAFTVYDGFVREAGPILDPRTSGRTTSATKLEDIAKCPFRYFLQRGLGLEPIDTAEPERDRWLDPATRGNILHGLYADILREVRAKDERLDPARHGTRLAAMGQARLEEHRRLVPPPSDHVFERERQETLDDLALFLRLEAEGQGREAVGFEVSFGAGEAEGERLAQAEPVTIDLGAGLTFRLRGRIDRIDRLADGTYEVVDYKTGGYWAANYTGAFRGGRLLQHALYALAATQLLRRTDPDARVSSSCYYFPTARGRAERKTCLPVSEAQIAAVLRDLFDTLAAGAFVHTANEKDDCGFCDFGRACGPTPFACAGKKAWNEANTVLAPYQRLARHA